VRLARQVGSFFVHLHVDLTREHGRTLRVELPCPELLESTLHFLYTGALLLPCMDKGMESDVLHGLLHNAKYVVCESLVNACTDIVYDRVKAGTHAPILGHPTLCPELVPAAFIHQVLVNGDLPGKRCLEVALAWAAHGDGLSEAQVTDLIPLIQELSEKSEDRIRADLSTRFPRGVAQFGRVLVADIAKRMSSLLNWKETNTSSRTSDKAFRFSAPTALQVLSVWLSVLRLLLSVGLDA
jgi:hypothetical protein